ncbi:BON domain-containing protein [Allorhizobium taibaishanense]|uniref:BON domain-containing protein n=1 Tax=Allorhizobium taibaishanense TaxID=887144 RepID=A0A1Q9A389_9HYPH|nr:BON domain-containing protein [Allorhizobium taibaishanense]MBB4006005.1 hypothetical protein [Allorhizobium taibaishanense]OLP49029.1 hypothetical protein BJF91_18105 [Allorhizobium taibaishanense]
MYFLSTVPAFSSSSIPAECSLCAALEALLAWTEGLDACRIRVTTEGGKIVLSGDISSKSALETAIVVAEVFTCRSVIADLAVRPKVFAVPSSSPSIQAVYRATS